MSLDSLINDSKNLNDFLIKSLKSYVKFLNHLSKNDLITLKSFIFINKFQMFLNNNIETLFEEYINKLSNHISIVNFEIDSLSKVKKNVKNIKKNFDLEELFNLVNILFIIEIIQKWRHEEIIRDNEELKLILKGIYYMPNDTDDRLNEEDIFDLKNQVLKLLPNSK